MKLTDSCYALTGFGYSTPWCVNAGLIAGSNTTLIVDTAANALAAATIFGYAKAVAPTNTLRVINTEKHFDHIGGNSFFKSQGIEIWGHASLHRTPEEFAAEVQEFNQTNQAQAFFSDTTLALPDHPIDRDTTFDLGHLKIEILMTPGHTQTNLSVWVPSERVLFCGDCLINRYQPNLNAGGPDDWATWLHSLDRIEKLSPSVVVAGHGPVIQASQLSKILDKLSSTLQRSITVGRPAHSFTENNSEDKPHL